jgi:hypothetical protein
MSGPACLRVPMTVAAGAQQPTWLDRPARACLLFSTSVSLEYGAEDARLVAR